MSFIKKTIVTKPKGNLSVKACLLKSGVYALKTRCNLKVFEKDHPLLQVKFSVYHSSWHIWFHKISAK